MQEIQPAVTAQSLLRRWLAWLLAATLLTDQPVTLHNLPRIGDVSTKLTLLQKLKLYNGKTLPGFTEDNIKELRKETTREGMEGISPRYIQDKISNALVSRQAIEEKCINPFMVINELEGGHSVAFATGIVHGDLGTSLRTNQPVTTVIFERMPATMELALAAMLVAIARGETTPCDGSLICTPHVCGSVPVTVYASYRLAQTRPFDTAPQAKMREVFGPQMK